MKKMINGVIRDMTTAEIAELQRQQEKAKIEEKIRPLTSDEINHLFIAQNINTIITDDATASRAVEFHPVLKENGSLISSGTRINWNGQLKRASVDLWDTKENNPDNAPTLWENIQYRNGYRIIPETITATLAFAEGECGWWGNTLYRSKVGGNAYTPVQCPDNWETLDEIWE